MHRRPGTHRPEQVAEVVRQVVATALVEGVRDPRVGPVTVTGVSVTRDLSHARIRVVIGGAEDDETRVPRALEGLASASGFLRSQVARALATRVVPELHFDHDLGESHRARIEAVLAGLREEPAP